MTLNSIAAGYSLVAYFVGSLNFLGLISGIQLTSILTVKIIMINHVGTKINAYTIAAITKYSPKNKAKNMSQGTNINNPNNIILQILYLIVYLQCKKQQW